MSQPSQLHKITTPVTKKDHTEKMNGSALYVGDFSQDDVLHGAIVRSPYAHASIVAIDYPQMPDGFFAVDHSDVPGQNYVHVVQDDTPVYAVNEVKYIGEAVAMIVGPCLKTAQELAAQTNVRYEQLDAILDIEASDKVFFDYHYGRGDTDAAFAQADSIIDEVFDTGYQEQAYLEPQGIIAEFSGGVLAVHGSMQCPYYVHTALEAVSGLEHDKVKSIQDYTGGGFGGKEAYPSILAAQTAVAAMKSPGKKVRVVFDRRQDMEFSSKRHPSRCYYKAAIKDGKVSALDITVLFNSGAYTTLSPVVLQRGIIAAPGVYNIPNLRVNGQARRTNCVPTGAFRGFGAPQTFFSVERLFDHIAYSLGKDSLEFKLEHLVKRGDQTSTSGIYHFDVPLTNMVDEVLQLSDYKAKRAHYSNKQSGRKIGGIGIALWYHGAGFTGSGERDKIKAVAALQKYADDTVEILASNTDMGQGLKTTFSKIVANELGIDLDQVKIINPDTSRVPDSGPTAASRSLMIVGELLRRAAARLKSEWQPGCEQRVEERYKEPSFLLPFDPDAFNGDAYPTYAWGVSVVELEIDTLTGTNSVLGCWSSFDIGTPIDMNVAIGQMEGGVMQGLGYASMEQMAADANGRIRNNSYSDYIIPTSVDIGELVVKMHVVEYPDGPYGAKGAGELPLVGIAPAFIAAAEQALGTNINHIPLTAEQTLELLGNKCEVCK